MHQVRTALQLRACGRIQPMRKRTRYSLLLALVVLAALVVALVLRKSAPPEAARLLPESDAILYVNVRPLRNLTHFDRPEVARSQQFQGFIDATGIVPERDLNAVAFALHRMDDPNGPNGPVAYSEVFEGSFDGARLRRYLASIATAEETYAGHTIYSIPVGAEVPAKGGKKGAPGQQRVLRVTQLGYDTVAASNMPTAEQIHSILDRYRAAASPFSGSSLLSERYRDVPLLSSAWAIGRIGLPFSESGRITVLGLQLPLAEDTTFVASLRYVGAIHLRIDELAPSAADAAASVAALQNLLGVFQSIQQLQQPSRSSAAFMEAMRTIRITQHEERAEMTATIPAELLRQLTNPEVSSAPGLEP